MESHKKGEYVVKLKVGETMDDSANLRELMAAFIAMEMDIPVIEPAAVEISPAFVKTVDDLAVKKRLQDSIGMNFGSRYIPGYPTIALASLPEKTLPFAQEIFAFDLLIQNLDRTKRKPNMLTDGEEIIMLDHEKAFGFTFASVIPVPVNIWEMNNDQKKWITDHILYPYVKRKKFDFNGFTKKMLNLNDPFWSKAYELIPDTWKTEQFDTIKDRLISFINNRNQFIKELKINMS